MCQRLFEIFKKITGFQSNLGKKERVRIQEEITENLSEIKKTASEIENSGTYLIHSDKDSGISKIKKLRQEMDFYEKKKVLKTDFTNEAKQALNEYSKLLSKGKKILATSGAKAKSFSMTSSKLQL